MLLRSLALKGSKSPSLLISKSLFALCDYIIYKKYGKLPKNHSERFRILEVRERAIFAEVDLVWSKYTETYSKPSGEESYKMLYEAIKRIIKNEKSCEGIEKSVEE